MKKLFKIFENLSPRVILAILSVGMQWTGLILKVYPLIAAGLIAGVALIFMSRSVKETAINAFIFIGPIPALVTLTLGSTFALSLFYSSQNQLSKIENILNVSMGLSFILLSILWPYLAGPLLVKLSYSKLRKKR